MSAFVSFLMFPSLILSILLHGAATAQHAAVTREDVHAAWQAKHEAIRSLFVATNYWPASERDKGHYLRSDISFGEDGSILLDSGHGWHDVDWRTFRFRTVSMIRNGSFSVSWPMRRFFESRAFEREEPIERFEVLPWVRASGYWPADAGLRCGVFFGCSLSLLEVSADAKYVVRRERERRLGVSCVVLEWPGRDVIYLDPDRGFALVRREWFLDGKVAMRVDVTGFERFGADVHLPLSYSFEPILEPDGTRVSVNAVKVPCQVLRYGFNEVEDDAFQLPSAPGTMRLIRTDLEKTRQVVAGGLDFLAAAGQRLRRLRGTSSFMVQWCSQWWSIALGLLLGAGWYFASRRRVLSSS